MLCKFKICEINSSTNSCFFQHISLHQTLQKGDEVHEHNACGRGSDESAQQRIDIEHQMIEMAIEASTNDKKPAEEPNSKLINVTQSVSGIG